MIQQIIALIIIAFFVWRLIAQKKKNQITSTEFYLWLVFWFLGALAIIFIKKIDALVESLGFSGAGINFLLYLAIIILFYLIFRLRLSIAKLDSNLTEVSRQVAINNAISAKDSKESNDELSNNL